MLDLDEAGKREIFQRMLDEKVRKLDLMDKYTELSSSISSTSAGKQQSSEDKNDTWTQQWTAKIIDNIELKVTNFHVRYEDSITIPNRRLV